MVDTKLKELSTELEGFRTFFSSKPNKGAYVQESGADMGADLLLAIGAYQGMIHQGRATSTDTSEIESVCDYLRQAKRIFETQYPPTFTRATTSCATRYPTRELGEERFHTLREISNGILRTALVSLAEKYNQKNPENRFWIDFSRLNPHRNRVPGDDVRPNEGHTYAEFSRFAEEKKEELVEKGMDKNTLTQFVNSLALGGSICGGIDLGDIHRKVPSCPGNYDHMKKFGLDKLPHDSDGRFVFWLPLWLRSQQYFAS